MKYRLPKASTQFIHTPSVCGLLWFGCFGVFPDHHIHPYTSRFENHLWECVVSAWCALIHCMQCVRDACVMNDNFRWLP